jgi:hypothetical protein
VSHPDSIHKEEGSGVVRWYGKFFAVVNHDEIDRACSMNGEKRNAYRTLVENPEGKRSLGRPRRRWWIILKWILGWDVQDRDQCRSLVNTVMALRVAYNVGKFSTRAQLQLRALEVSDELHASATLLTVKNLLEFSR